MEQNVSLWREIQRKNFTRLDSLTTFLELSELQKKELWERPRFALNLPLRLAQKIEKGKLSDPILSQFIPSKKECATQEGFQMDPVGDLCVRKGQKLLHKYEGRALLMPTSACAMHCRYCFRQNFPYETGLGCEEELKIIGQDTSLQEIILSGGDPLSLSNEMLGALLSSLSECKHVKRIRFHTRFPIGIPERIDAGLLSMFATHPQQIVFVIHANHPKELDRDVLSSLQQIGKLGIPLLNQSVLLRGVNDQEDTLLSLCQTLVNGGILPYYLHLLDRVEGSAHFEVSLERGKELISYLQRRLSGYGVPRLTREEAGKPSKTFL